MNFFSLAHFRNAPDYTESLAASITVGVTPIAVEVVPIVVGVAPIRAVPLNATI